MSSIEKNFIYNLSITLAQYVAGLIVFPHVSRCLGVELMGKTSFATNVVAYFSLFALLGASLAAMYKSYNIRVGLIPLYSIISSAFIALSDECIQLLSDGRAFQFIDILIDISGALAGTIFIVIFILIFNRNKKRIK